MPEYFDSNRPMSTLLPSIRSLLRDPRAFFRSLPKQTRYQEGVFLLSLTILACAFLSAPFAGMTMLFLFPVIWGIFLGAAWIWSRYLRWAVHTLARQPLGKVTAFDIAAYGSIPMAICSLPYLGILGFLGSLYLQTQALIHLARINPGTAWMIVLIPSMAILALAAAIWVGFLATAFHVASSS